MHFEFIRGSVDNISSFIRVPRILFIAPEFDSLSNEAKLLYCMMLDRAGLSLSNSWVDASGRAYIYFTMFEVQRTLGCGQNKALRLLSELDTEKGIGLIQRKKQGQGKPSIIYVKQIVRDMDDLSVEKAVERLWEIRQDFEEETFRSPDTSSSGALESKVQDFAKGETNYNNKKYNNIIYTEQVSREEMGPGWTAVKKIIKSLGSRR